MRYMGAQPRDGDTPAERFAEFESVMKANLELWFAAKLESRDDIWARLGMLQIYLEHGLTVTLRTVLRAIKDCERLEAEKYADEWKKAAAFREGIALTKAALTELAGDMGSEETDRSLVVDLGRDTLLLPAISERLRVLWKRAGKEQPQS
jgi:DNA mismatch repair ATPase MutS